MMRIVLLGKRASARPAIGQRFGSAAAPANAAISIRRDVKQRSIEGPPEFEDVDLQQFYQGVGPAAPGTGRAFGVDDNRERAPSSGRSRQSLRGRVVAARAHALAQRLEAFLARDRP